MVSAGPISSSSTVTVPNRSCSEAVRALIRIREKNSPVASSQKAMMT